MQINFEEELLIPFQDMTEEAQDEYIREWTQATITWINRARSYIKQSETVQEKLSKYNINTLSNYNQMLKNRRMAKEMLLNKTVLRDGYILLNRIGEIIRGEEIKYSVTVTKTGRAIDDVDNGGVYTFEIPLSEFINLMDFTTRRINLKSSSTIYRMIEKQIDQNAKDINYEKWTDQKLQSFSLFAKQVRAYPQWEAINNGNILEGFLRFLSRGHQPATSASPEYHEEVYSAMLDTMKNPDKFFEGGDLNNLQIKGLNASITNLNTLVKNLDQVLLILSKHTIGKQVLMKYMKKQALNQQLNKELQTTQENIVNDLIAFFKSNIQR